MQTAVCLALTGQIASLCSRARSLSAIIVLWLDQKWQSVVALFSIKPGQRPGNIQPVPPLQFPLDLSVRLPRYPSTPSSSSKSSLLAPSFASTIMPATRSTKPATFSGEPQARTSKPAPVPCVPIENLPAYVGEDVLPKYEDVSLHFSVIQAPSVIISSCLLPFHFLRVFQIPGALPEDPFSPSALEEAKTIKRDRKHRKKNSENGIPRPRNKFILYRVWINSEIVLRGYKVKSAVTSTYAGLLWNRASEKVKEHFAMLAKEEYIRHTAKFPTYVYRPTQSCERASSNFDVDNEDEQSRASDIVFDAERPLQFPSHTPTTPDGDRPPTSSSYKSFRHNAANFFNPKTFVNPSYRYEQNMTAVPNLPHISRTFRGGNRFQPYPFLVGKSFLQSPIPLPGFDGMFSQSNASGQPSSIFCGQQFHLPPEESAFDFQDFNAPSLFYPSVPALDNNLIDSRPLLAPKSSQKFIPTQTFDIGVAQPGAGDMSSQPTWAMSGMTDCPGYPVPNTNVSGWMAPEDYNNSLKMSAYDMSLWGQAGQGCDVAQFTSAAELQVPDDFDFKFDPSFFEMPGNIHTEF